MIVGSIDSTYATLWLLAVPLMSTSWTEVPVRLLSLPWLSVPPLLWVPLLWVPLLWVPLLWVPLLCVQLLPVESIAKKISTMMVPASFAKKNSISEIFLKDSQTVIEHRVSEATTIS